MAEGISSVRLGDIIQEFGLEVLNKGTNYENVPLRTVDVNRPGLPLTGFFEHFDTARLLLIGLTEYTYLETLEPEKRRERFEALLSYPVPGLIVTRGMEPFPECMEMAEKYDRTVLRTKAQTSAFMSNLIGSLCDRLAPKITRSGVMMEVYGEGVLFRMGAIKDKQQIDLVIDLEPWDDHAVYDRLGLDTVQTDILGVKVPEATIPVKPGRNLASIVEVAAMNNRNRKMGHNAALELTNRMDRHFEKLMEEGDL